MRRRHDRDSLLAGAVAAALDDGLGELSFGRLGKRLGVADRTIVYYFPTKQALLEAVVADLSQRLFAQVAVAFGDGTRPAASLVRRAWPVLVAPEAHRTFAVFFEFAGQAAVGHEPQRPLALAAMHGWIDWVAERVEAPTPARARAEAAWVVATLDGALLLHHLGLEAEAQAAVRRATA